MVGRWWRWLVRWRRLLRRRRIVRRRRRLRELVMSLSQEDRRRISDAVRLIEDRTSGEIVCVLAESSTGAAALPVFIAALAALAIPWLLVVLTPLTVYRILTLQVAV